MKFRLFLTFLPILTFFTNPPALRAATIANQPEDIGFIKIQSSLLSSLFKHGQQDNEQIVELLGNSWPVIAMGMAACPDISEQDMCMIYACVLNLLSKDEIDYIKSKLDTGGTRK